MLVRRLKKIATSHPKISQIGHQVLKRIWAVQANFTNYEFPREASTSITLNEVKEYNKNRKFGPRKRICYAPFNNMHFTINGKVAACSFNIDYYIGDINNNSIQEIWFGKKADEFRSYLANYNFEKCMTCKSILDSKNFSSFPPLKYDLNASNQSHYPTQMSFEMSNLCNLECIMCNGDFSSLIRKNRDKLPPISYKYPSDFINQLEEFIPHLKIASFIGGEPLLIKQYYEIWEKIVAINPKCTIHIQTNATVLTDKFLELANKGSFDIGISVDAFSKELYEKIRVNAKYVEVQENIHTLIELQKEGKVTLNINYCPLVNNWQETPLMLEFANTFNTSFKILNVDSPTNLALRYQNSKLLENIYETLTNWPLKDTTNFMVQNNIKGYKQFLSQIKHMIIDSKKNESIFVSLSNQDYETIVLALKSELLDNPVNAYFSIEERKELHNICMNYINSLQVNKEDKKIILSKIIIELRGLEGDRNAQKTIEECFTGFKKMANGFLNMSNS